MNKLGEKIRCLRREEGITLRELGNRLNISFSLLAMYERGERTPPLDKLKLLADFFQVTTDYLIGKSKIKKFPDDKHIALSDQEIFNDLIYIPVVNKISQANIVAEENIINYRTLNCQEVSTVNNCFYLQVGDNSMANSHIKRDSIILIQKQAHFKNGDICLVLLDDKQEKQAIIIRKVFQVNEQIFLQADNQCYDPIIIHKSAVIIIGKVIKVELDF